MGVEQAIRALVLEGAKARVYEPGAKLPTERALVDQLGAPRSAVRQALAALERDGLVVRQVGRGTFLTDVAIDANSAPPDTSPAEIMQVRLLLEPQVAMLAARMATQADLTQIRRDLEDGAQSAREDFEGFESADSRLHRAIARATHNGLLLSTFDVLTTARALPVWGSLKRTTSSPERRCRYHEQHCRIVEALSDRDSAGAAEAMRSHLQSVSENLLGGH